MAQKLQDILTVCGARAASRWRGAQCSTSPLPPIGTAGQEEPTPDEPAPRTTQAGIGVAATGLASGMGLEFGVILPTSSPDPGRAILGDVRESARYAEEVGLDSVWSTDHLVASAPILESSVVLATAAAVTERIIVGYNVMLLALRPVAWAAKQISTLQLVSNNRLVLGVGTGNPAHGDAGWRAAGVEYTERGRLTDEALAVLP